MEVEELASLVLLAAFPAAGVANGAVDSRSVDSAASSIKACLEHMAVKQLEVGTLESAGFQPAGHSYLPLEFGLTATGECTERVSLFVCSAMILDDGTIVAFGSGPDGLKLLPQDSRYDTSKYLRTLGPEADSAGSFVSAAPIETARA